MKKVLSTFTLITGCALLFTACKKDDSSAMSDDMEKTVEMSENKAIADYLTEDVHQIMMEAAADEDLMGNRPSVGTLTEARITSCATVTVTPLVGFPKTVLIDFGTGCTDPRGITRSGSITVVISDSLRRPGSQSVMTFQNYFVQGFKKEGTITWTNTSIPGRKSWSREVVNGKITIPSGTRFWMHESMRDVEQVAGVQTPRLILDDAFVTTGYGSVTNPGNITRTDTIVTPLHKAVSCDNIDRGTVRFTGPNHVALLDFGNGTCDRIATISINGFPPRTILLR
ncbi:MAG TPA: hypothetical protein DEU93_07590 [Chitinophagaceae bacterium]|nr:hypothetical protein [Chitinophagaceae bacterium]HML57171.1 hypothetical protein [Ferruginibacter sp.]